MHRLLLIVVLLHTSFALCQDGALDFVRTDLLRIEQVYRILDGYGEKIWPGWKNYREIPFHLKYPGGTRVLTAHPNPPAGYKILENATVGGNPVYVNFSGRSETGDLSGFAYYGAVGMLGERNGIPVQTIEFDLRPFRTLPKYNQGALASADYQILVCIHELFHHYQNTRYTFRHGRSIDEPVVEYLVYSEVEGKALLNALKSTSNEKSKSFVADFLVARSLKKRFLSNEQFLSESEQEVNEGLAEYTMLKVLDYLDEKQSYVVDNRRDPSFNAFRNREQFLQNFVQRLHNESENTLESRMKPYFYGGVQAFLLDRFVSDWKKKFYDMCTTLDDLLRGHLFPGRDFDDAQESNLSGSYDIDKIRSRYTSEFGKRANCFSDFIERKGVPVIVSFRHIQPFLEITTDKPVYKYDRFALYPSGIDSIHLGNVLFVSKGSPILKAMFSYLKYIPTDSSDFTLKCESRQDNGMFRNVVIETSGFTLRAPLAKVFQNERLVKVAVYGR